MYIYALLVRIIHKKISTRSFEIAVSFRLNLIIPFCIIIYLSVTGERDRIGVTEIVTVRRKFSQR